jgi:hypothetical protein
VQESGRVFAEWKDAESDKFEFGICGCEGVFAQSTGEAEQVVA